MPTLLEPTRKHAIRAGFSPKPARYIKKGFSADDDYDSPSPSPEPDTPEPTGVTRRIVWAGRRIKRRVVG